MSDRRRRTLLVVLPALSVGVWLLVMGPPPSLVLPRAEREQYEILVKADSFAGRAVGIAGIEPPEAHAFMKLAAHPRGGTAFKYVLLRGTTAAKIYALTGLRRTNPRFFSVAVQPFRIWPGRVETVFGCILSAERVSQVIESDDPNAVRLGRGQTLREWFRARASTTNMVLDVMGGGYTSMFLEGDQLTRPAG